MTPETKDALLALVGTALILFGASYCAPARGHDWYPPSCCSGHDCRLIDTREVETRSGGFFIHESRELIPYSDPRVRKTPPEGGNNFHRCSKGGAADSETICIYIPNWGA